MNHIRPTFDTALLALPTEDRVAYFQRKVIAHEHLTQAFNLALDNIDFSSEGEIVPIVGPTGVGTTVLGRRIWTEYQRKGTDGASYDPGVRNANSIGLDAPCQAGSIDAKYWNRLLSCILCRGGDILIDQKSFVPAHEFSLTHSLPFGDTGRMGIDALVTATASMLKHRKTKVVLINQADRLFPESDPVGCTRSQQILMDLAARTEARFVLIGGYRLVHASYERDNWLRRQHIVHFRRYDRYSPHEYEKFVQVLMSLLASMPTDRRLEEISQAGAEQFYFSSIGCVGSLKKMLTMAFQHSLRTGQALTESFILDFALRNVVAVEVAKDARLGEARLTDVDYDEVRRVLEAGLTRGPEKIVTATPAKSRQGNATGRTGIGARRIGERKATRDPVGGLHA